VTVYPKKNSKGQHTGKWQVEAIDPAGKRVKRTEDSLVEARRIEAAIKAGTLSAGSVGVSSGIYTIGDLRRDAKVIWRGNKSAALSIKRFDACCDILGDATDVRSVRTRQLDSLVAELGKRKLSGSTIHRYLASISAALRWAWQRELISGMPHVPWPEQNKGRDVTVSSDDEARLVAWFHTNGYEAVGTIYEVLLATGMRIDEVLSLQPACVDPVNETVTLKDTKNGDDREVPLEKRLCDALLAIIEGEGMPGYFRVNRAAHRAAKALGIEHSVTPHVMRHTVVTRLEERGVGLRTIGQLVGHRSIKTTAGYAHPDIKALRAAAGKLKG
jgi:integrase